MSLTIEHPSTRIPQCTATIASGTVDMPTASAPIIRRNRYSARVSKFGPNTATNTPLCAAKFSRRAISKAFSIRTRS
jgi:hypothetical protein